MAESTIIFSDEVELNCTVPNLIFNEDSPARLREVQVWEAIPSLDDLSKLIVGQHDEHSSP